MKRHPLYAVFDDDLEPLWRATASRRGLGTQRVYYGTKRGRYVHGPMSVDQRVITQISRCERKRTDPKGRMKFAANMRVFARYIGRHQATQDVVFDRDGKVDRPVERVEPWTDDQRYYRLMLSPEHGNRMTDMERYVREVMSEVEQKVFTVAEYKAGMRLEWIAAIHTNTNRQHAHVLIRGQIGREELNMLRCFETKGISSLAREVATRAHHLGPRRWREVVAERELAANKDVIRDLERRAARKPWSAERG